MKPTSARVQIPTDCLDGIIDICALPFSGPKSKSKSHHQVVLALKTKSLSGKGKWVFFIQITHWVFSPVFFWKKSVVIVFSPKFVILIRHSKRHKKLMFTAAGQLSFFLNTQLLNSEY